MTFKQFVKKMLNKARHLAKAFMLFIYPVPRKPTVIVVMDGGLCSQMFEYSLGELFRQNGYKVLFDLRWFDGEAYDVLGKNRRYFEINKLYPSLKIKRASSLCMEKFIGKWRTSESDIQKIIDSKKHVYLVNDHPLNVPSDELNVIFHKLYDNPCCLLDGKALKFATEIQSDKNSCAVHVRRGDLAVDDIAVKSGYGNAVTDRYYDSAITLVRRLVPEVKFYFFSDDLPYVKNVLVPRYKNLKYSIVDVGYTGGYKDFFLIYLCKHQLPRWEVSVLMLQN